MKGARNKKPRNPSAAGHQPAAVLVRPETAWRDRYLPWALVLAVILSAGIVRVRLLDIPLERDEGEYAYAGQLILQGIPPYQLAANMKFPGTYAAYTAIMAVFGESVPAIHFGLLIVNAAAILLVYLLGKRLFTPLAGLAACASYALLSLGVNVEGLMAHATHFIVLFVLAGTLLLLRALDSGSSRTLFWSGLLYGLAILMKQHGLVFAAFGGGYLLWKRRSVRLAALFAGGVVMPYALTCAILWKAGVFGRFWFWTVTYARQYVTENSLSDGWAVLRGVLPHIVGPAWLLWAAAGVGMFLVLRSKEDRASGVWITLFLVASVAAVCPGFYFREHYFILMLPALALLAGAGVGAARRMFSNPAPLWLFGAILMITVIGQREFLFQWSPVQAARKVFGVNPFVAALPVADYIRAHTAPDSRIAVMGSEPEIYFYAGRHAATSYIYTYGMMEPQPYALVMQNEMIRDLEAARPEYIVGVVCTPSWLRRPKSPTRILDWWDQYSSRHYTPVGIVDIFSDVTLYRWDAAVSGYRPRSSSYLVVYKRND